MNSDGQVVMNVLGSRSAGQDNANSVEEGGAGYNSKQSSAMVSSLPIMSLDYETEETLMTCLYRSAKVRQFLQWTANYWPDPNQRKTVDEFHKLHYRFVLGALSLIFFLMLSSIVINAVMNEIAPMLVAVTVSLDILSALPAQYLNQQRMRHKAYVQDASVIDESLRIATYYGFFCATTIALSLLVLLLGESAASYYYSNVLSLAFAQILISLYLSFNMLFLMMDLRVSSLLIDQLFLLTDKQMLTVEKFNIVRSDIHRRVKKSQYASDFILGPCLASVFTILILAFHMDKNYVFISFAWMIALTKELVFIFIAFWFVAKVNGRADELTRQLSSTVWVGAAGSVVSGTTSTAMITGVGSGGIVQQKDTMQQCLDRCDNMQTDMQRMTICVSCFTDPISFTLLFKRVSWQNVAVSAAGFVFTMFVAVVKSIVGAA